VNGNRSRAAPEGDGGPRDLTLFYFPYAGLETSQRALLRLVALYFDRLYLLDPEKATGGTVGAGEIAAEARALEAEDVGLLERFAPEDVISIYADAIAQAIQEDMSDPEFVALCEKKADESGRHMWTIAIAKVPLAIREDPRYQPLDNSMRNFLGKAVPSIAGDARQYNRALRRGIG
jgi:hypothetical protein